MSTCKTVIVNAYLTPYAEINSKWIKDLNIRTKTIKFFKKKTGVILYYLG